MERSGRGFGGNVLEAAMLSLQDTSESGAAGAGRGARAGAARSRAGTGNGGFEVAATWFTATGKRDLLDLAINAADALYEDFKANNPPFSGGERDAINCLQLYRVTRDKKHLDLAKHYLDIRGLENSVNRSRHNQSYKPVLEQSEAVGHAVNGVTLMVSLADVGVLTGLRRTSPPRSACGRTRSRRRCTSPAASARPATRGSASRTRCRTSPPTPKPARC